MKFYDRIKETTTTTGTGTVTLGGAGAGGFVTFSSKFAVNDLIPYLITNNNGDWEVGYGYLVSTTTLSRIYVYSSSNSGSLVSFSSGTKEVFCNVSAFLMSRVEPMGHTLAKCLKCDMP